MAFPLVMLFQLLYPIGRMVYAPNFFYGDKLLERHIFVNFTFQLTFLDQIFELGNFRKFYLKIFRPQIRNMCRDRKTKRQWFILDFLGFHEELGQVT